MHYKHKSPHVTIQRFVVVEVLSKRSLISFLRVRTLEFKYWIDLLSLIQLLKNCPNQNLRYISNIDVSKLTLLGLSFLYAYLSNLFTLRNKIPISGPSPPTLGSSTEHDLLFLKNETSWPAWVPLKSESMVIWDTCL